MLVTYDAFRNNKESIKYYFTGVQSQSPLVLFPTVPPLLLNGQFIPQISFYTAVF